MEAEAGSGSRRVKILSLPLSHRLFDLKSNSTKKFCPFPDVGEVLLLLFDPLRGMGHGGGPWSPRNRATPKGLDQRSYSGCALRQALSSCTLIATSRQRVAKERAAQRVRSWTVQNEMRGVLGRVSAGAAKTILDSANSREIRAQQ